MEDRLRLWSAAWDGNAGLVKQYLRVNDDIEQLGGHLRDSTPLMAACRMGNFECIRVLLENNAYLEHRDTHNCTALRLLVSEDDSGMTSNFAEPSVVSNREEFVSLMLDMGADMYSFDEHGDNMIAIAVKSHLCGVVKILLGRHKSNGNDPFGAVNGAVNMETGDTAVHAAVMARHECEFDMSMVDMLIEMGADVHKPNYCEESAFMSAAKLAEDEMGEGENLNSLMRVLLMYSCGKGNRMQP